MGTLYIAKSKIRQGILALFFTHVTQKYYLRQLERLLGYSAGSVRRELLKFQEDGLFETEKVGNLLYYFLNIRHPLFSELKSIVFKTIGVEGSLKKALKDIKGIKFSFIYGSFARQKEKAASDIDILIVGDMDSSKLNEKIAVLEKKLKREINPTVYSLKEYKDKKNKKSGFIIDLLKQPKILLVGQENDL